MSVKSVVPDSVSRYRIRAATSLVLAVWLLYTATFGGDRHVVLLVATSMLGVLAWTDLQIATRLRRDEQAKQW
jgi:hypothetical protein